jgi:hypothetical protein
MTSQMTKVLLVSTMNVNESHLIGPDWIDTCLPAFSGEPDGGLLWLGEDFPFAILEVGFSDSGKKTRGRSIHWLTRGRGSVCPK